MAVAGRASELYSLLITDKSLLTRENSGILPAGAGIVMVLWEGTEPGVFQVPGCGWLNLGNLFTHHPLQLGYSSWAYSVCQFHQSARAQRAVSSCCGGSWGVVPKYAPKQCLAHDLKLVTRDLWPGDPRVEQWTATSVCIIYHENGEVDLQQPKSDLDPDPLVGTYIVFPVVIRAHTKSSDWEAS